MNRELGHNINDRREKLMDYLCQELRPDEAQAFELHLEGCPACQRDVADFRQVKEALATWELEGVPHISLSIDAQPKRSWFELFRALPLWMRLVSAAAAAMLLLALFNVQVGYNAKDGFQFRASLIPQSKPAPPSPTIGFTEDEVKAVVAAAVQQANQKHSQKLAAQLDQLAKELRWENQQKLTKLARTLRQEQENRIFELTDQAQNSYTTLTDLLGGGARNGY
ncbi:MAG: zf-HC2 domain-containing protein [Acidobacteria bacterium]|nr:zf-HC2 domain-containing protein [Acidobacteriota bacterium]